MVEHNLVLVKLDKGEALIILTRAQYDDKINHFLQTAAATCTTFSLTSHNSAVRSAIRSSHLIVPKDHHERLLVSNYDPPKFHGRIKIHKLDHPIRMVVAFFTDFSYKLAKYLAQWF